jgi:hypothetical protein
MVRNGQKRSILDPLNLDLAHLGVPGFRCLFDWIYVFRRIIICGLWFIWVEIEIH